jgi:hypothetical protein
MPKGQARKLIPQYIGPVKVLQKDGVTNTYTLDLPEDMCKRCIHLMFHIGLVCQYEENDNVLFTKLIGQFNNQITITNIMAYLAANGLTTQDTDNVIWWAHSTTWEMVNQIEELGEFENSSTSILYKPIRWDLQVQCPEDSFTHTWEWYKSEAQSQGVPQSEVPFLVMSLVVQMEHQVFKWLRELWSSSTLSPILWVGMKRPTTH